LIGLKATGVNSLLCSILIPIDPFGVLTLLVIGLGMPEPNTRFDGVIVKGAIIDEELVESLGEIKFSPPKLRLGFSFYR